MATLPSSLALTTISDGALATAADLRNNFTAVQTENNSLLTILGAGAAGDVFTGVGTTVQYAKPPGYEYAYAQITSNVSVTSTTESAGTAVVTAPAFTVDGSTLVIVEFSAAAVQPAAAIGAIVTVCLFEGATELGRFGGVGNPAAQQMFAPFSQKFRITPSAASHTYAVTAFQTNGNGIVTAGAGGTGAYAPAFIRITKA